MQDVQATLPVGTLIRTRYLVKSLVGKGNSGAVYLVEDQRPKRAGQNMFALKEIIGLSQQERYAFTLAGVPFRQIHHQALPRIYHVFNDNRRSRVCIVMDYVDGPDLETLCQHQPEQRFTWPEVAQIMPSIIDAVSHLHRQVPSNVHGDIKPVNILLAQPEERFMLVDIGVAREQQPDTDSSSYKAPEQNGKSVDMSADVYGLGATMYTLLTGVLPTAAHVRVARLEREQIDPLQPANKLVPTIPSHISRAIHRAMSINADERFASVEEFWEALQNPAKELTPTVEDSVSPAATSTLVDSSTKEQGASEVVILSEAKDLRLAWSHILRFVQNDSQRLLAGFKQLTRVRGKDDHTLNQGSEAGATAGTGKDDPTLNRKPEARATARMGKDDPTLNRGPASRATARVAPTLDDGKFSRFFFIKGHLVPVLLVVLLVLVGMGVGIWSLAQGHQGSTIITKSAGTTPHALTTPALSSTVPIVTPTSSPGLYPSVVGSYTGTLVDIPTKGSATMILQGVHQVGGTINGFLTLGAPLAINGPFRGTIDFSKHFHFIVTDAASHPLLFIEGSIQTATSLSGDFYKCASAPSQGETCLRASDGYGIWSALLVSSH